MLFFPNRLLGSAYPASREHDLQTWMTEQIIVNSSIEVVVNLMEAKELPAFAPYKDMMTQYACKGPVDRNRELSTDSLVFLQ